MYIVASIHLCNMRGLVPVSYDVINIVKELVFQYIEHGILKYDFVYYIDMYLL